MKKYFLKILICRIRKLENCSVLNRPKLIKKRSIFRLRTLQNRLSDDFSSFKFILEFYNGQLKV